MTDGKPRSASLFQLRAKVACLGNRDRVGIKVDALSEEETFGVGWAERARPPDAPDACTIATPPRPGQQRPGGTRGRPARFGWSRRGVRTHEDSAVSINFDLPAPVEDQLRRELADLIVWIWIGDRDDDDMLIR